MTSLTLSLSRSLARTWRPGDEVIVTRLEHDANFTPWVLAARDAGAIVRHVDIHPEDCTLNLENFHSLITERTKLVAVGCASNAVGTINPVKQICRWAKEVGALTFLDAVHFAPHALISVEDWGCDFLACSAYKFFGPHVGMLWGKRELLESLTPYKLRPAPGSLPGKWMTGTQNHECLAGTLGAIEYLTAIGRRGREIESTTRRAALSAAFAAITLYERGLFEKLLTGLQSIAGVKIFGITNPADFDRRLPTVSLTHPKFTSRELAQRLGQRGIFTWHGNFYALPLTESLGVEPDGMLRVGLVHYNTAEEVQRLIVALQCELA